MCVLYAQMWTPYMDCLRACLVSLVQLQLLAAKRYPFVSGILSAHLLRLLTRPASFRCVDSATTNVT